MKIQELYLLFIIIFVFTIFYLQSYFKITNFEIIQTNLENFDNNLLYEKKPIYLYDEIVNPADLLHTIFKFQYIYHILSISDKNLLKQNLSRFVIIYNDSENETILSIYHPDSSKLIESDNYKYNKKNFLILHKNEIELQKIDVKLKSKNCIILPLHYCYQTSNSKLIEIHLFDFISMISSFLS